MSILVRTGNGITDLKYVDSATEGLKVLQKTGEKTVRWITTENGKTYNNILQKRGIKDLYYGSISVIDKATQWYKDPMSGAKVSYNLSVSKSIDMIVNFGKQTYFTSKKPAFPVINGTLTDISLSNADFKKTASKTTYIALFDTVNAWQPELFDTKVKKIFAVSKTNPNNSLVVLVTFNDRETTGSGMQAEKISNYSVREIHNSLSLTDNEFYLGVRSTDS